MTLISLILRESKWWKRSPATWWTLPYIFIFAACWPVGIFFIFDQKVIDYQELENRFNITRQWINLSTAFHPLFKDFPWLIDTINELEFYMTTEIVEIWKMRFVQHFQQYGYLSLMFVTPPLAVGIFNRDRHSKILIHMQIFNCSAFKIILAKLMTTMLVIAVVHALSYVVFLKTMSHITHHPILFQLDDPIWIWSWLVGWSIGGLSIPLCWYMCLVSQNQISEHYNAYFIIPSFLFIPCTLLWQFQTLTVDGLAMLFFLIITLTIISLIPIAFRMRQESFHLH